VRARGLPAGDVTEVLATGDRSSSAGRRGPVLLSWRRLLTSLAGGVVAAAVTVVLGVPEISVLVGWSVAAGGLLAWVWRTAWPRDSAGTRQLAEDEGRTRVTDATVLVAAVVSLVAVGQALFRSGSGGAVAVATVVLCVVVVALSWALVNTVFALKYARRYFTRDGGMDFGQDGTPAYSDFAYAAFTVGMSFAVSDSEITDRGLRKVALGHALLSYVFGTVVVAVAVNLVTDLGGQG